jgi:hypothetical protein
MKLTKTQQKLINRRISQAKKIAELDPYNEEAGSPQDWAGDAARVIFADMREQGTFGWAFGDMDDEFRVMLVATMAEIIRRASPPRE